MRTTRHPMGGGQKTRSVQLWKKQFHMSISLKLINLKPVKYMLLLEVPVLVALPTVTAGRRVKWFRIWQLMLGRKGELRSRLFGHVISLPYIHIGQHWHPDPRSRWSAVMSSRFSVRIGSGWAAAPDWCPAPVRHGIGKKNGKVASLELF